jgi:two-component system chemotaxis response regulator CheB
VLRSAAADLPVPLLIVQHMPLGFTRPFAERLNGLSRLRVSEAAGGERLVPGIALVAPAGRHLRIRPDRTAEVSEEPADLPHRPSVDVLMTSACDALGDRVVAVLLTGMGDDGANGMVQIRRRGGLTIAESDATCVVSGMPRAAYLRGGASLYLPLHDIAALFNATA